MGLVEASPESQSKPGEVKVSQGQSQPLIAACTLVFPTPRALLGKPNRSAEGVS